MSNIGHYIDLHMHSFYSDDGELSPEELVKRCYDSGIRIMSITDHNNVRAVEEAKIAAKKYHITYISGIEIDCTYKAINLHVIGYGMNHHLAVFNAIEESIINQEKACAIRKIELTNKLGFDVKKEDLDRLSENGVYTGEMFAEVLLRDKRYEEHALLKPYREGGLRSDNPYVNFYWDFYAQRKPCYTEIVYPTLEETIRLIKDSGGIAVLAHPGNNLRGKYELFEEMVELGLQGVEVFSSYHDEEAINYFLEKGRKQNLLLTCGSDYHGKIKPAIQIGGTGCTITEEEIVQQLVHLALIDSI